MSNCSFSEDTELWEIQTEEGEALRDDKRFTFASTWEFKGVDEPPVLHKEDLGFETVKPTQRSYK